jgi:hypothetical protein
MSTTLANPLVVTKKSQKEIELENNLIEKQGIYNYWETTYKSYSSITESNETTLKQAETDKSSATTNLSTYYTASDEAKALVKYSEKFKEELSLGKKQTVTLSKKLAKAIQQFLIAADSYDLLAEYVDYQKAINPLVPDDLVANVKTTGESLNAAYELLVVALESTNSVVYNAKDSSMITNQEVEESKDLEESLPNKKGDIIKDSLRENLNKEVANTTASVNHANTILSSSKENLNYAAVQMEEAKMELDSAQAELNAAKAALA